MTTATAPSASFCFRSRRGFTLIEVIATFLLSAVLVALFLPLIGSSLQGSRRALLSMPETQSLRTEMDTVWQLYRTTYANDLPALSEAVAAHSSPSSEVLYNGWVDFDAKGKEYIPETESQKVLRVTLGNDDGERLTAYFAPIP